MISKHEILQLAAQTHMSPHVVEKDYLLGWVLAGIRQHPLLCDQWIFKGGTSLKKCYFDDYRFSEDLDFTVLNSKFIEPHQLATIFFEISEWLYNFIGIEVLYEKSTFELHKDGSCQGKIYYRGPIAPTSTRQLPKIKIDLTINEVIVTPPILTVIKHPYSDQVKMEMCILCYSLVEVFAEKIRALAERTRPRDLYDVINLFQHPDSAASAKKVSEVLQKKCNYKKIAFPKYEDLMQRKETCQSGWNTQLLHQVPVLPAFELFWDKLLDLFAWLSY